MKYGKALRGLVATVSVAYGLYVGTHFYLYQEADSQLRDWRADEDREGLSHLSLYNIQGSDRDLPPEDLGRMITRLEEWEDARDYHKAKMFNPFARFESIYNF